MHADNDSDRAIEHLLRLRGATESAAPVSDACADGETVAAWTEGRLDTATARSVEEHLADCSRCRALLAAFARTDVTPPAASPLWRRWRLQWLVPVATAATVATVWIAAPRPALAPSAPAEQRMARLEAPVAGLPSEPARADERELETAATAPSRDAAATTNAAAKAAAADAPAETTAAPDPPLARAERSRLDDRQEADVVGGSREAQSPAPAGASALAASPRAAVSQMEAFEVRSSVPGVRWRLEAGRFEYTRSDGAEWVAASIPAPEVLRAGSAPLSSVCWVVGSAGAIYVSIDGVTFAQVPPPEAQDFIRVQATDAQAAIVTAADGRAWRTGDQGRTWVPAAQ